MKRSFELDRVRLKYLVIAAMLLDHIAWAFVPLCSFQGQLFHFIGRMTGPVMAYFLAEGFLYTKDRQKYGIRLFLFALISWPAFSLFEKGTLSAGSFGVIYSLFLGYLALCLEHSVRYPETVKTLGLVALIFASVIGDWAVYDVVIPVCLVRLWGEEKRKQEFFLWANVIFALCAMFSSQPISSGFFHLGMVLPPLVLRYFYHGKRGNRHGFHKWFFYWFYPVHLLILYLLNGGPAQIP